MKTLILTLALICFTSGPLLADAPKEKTLTWSFSAENSYPREKAAVKPAELARHLDEIRRLDSASDPLSGSCGKAIEMFSKVIDEYPDNISVYRSIPNCDLGENAFRAIVYMLVNKMPVEKMKLDPRLEGFFQKGDLFFSKALGSDPTADILDAYLSFIYSKGGYDLSRWISEEAIKLAASKKSRDENVAKGYMRGLNRYITWMAGEENLKIARRLYELKRSNTRSRGMLGSLLVGNSFTTILNEFLAAAAVSKKEMSGDESLGFFKEKGKLVEPQLDEALELLTPLCRKKHIDQACRDVELAKFLKDPKKE